MSRRSASRDWTPDKVNTRKYNRTRKGGQDDTLQAAGVYINMAEVGVAWQNGYAERLMRTIKDGEVDLTEDENNADAGSHIGRFLDEVYMQKRNHCSFGFLTPA